jgi:hypothetical protein
MVRSIEHGQVDRQLIAIVIVRAIVDGVGGQPEAR